MLGCCVDKKYGTGCTPKTCMQLPEDETCGACASFARCQGLFDAKPDSTTCDFFPRRFRSLPIAQD